MKSPMIAKADYIADKESYTDLMVLESPAGFYIGTLYNNPAGYQEPGSRDSGYFAKRAEAERELCLMVQFECGAQMLRKHP